MLAGCRSMACCAIGLLSAAAPALAPPLGTAFTYQGHLKKNGGPVNGTADLMFTLFDAEGTGSPPVGGAQIGSAQSVSNVAVTDGVFTVTLNGSGQFGPNAFNGDARWLQIAVRSPSGGGVAFTTLSPRQPMTPAPYALQTRGLTVNPSGFLGVGVASPLARVHLGGTPGVDGLRFPDGTLQTTAAIGAASGGVPSAMAEFTSPGSHNWMAPAGVTRVMIEAWGAGGGGGAGGIGGTAPTDFPGSGGGGGGAGAYSRGIITVTPGLTYTVIVGTGGAGGFGLAQNGPESGTPGGDTRFVAPDTTILFASGGGAGGEHGNPPGFPGFGGTGGAADPAAPIKRNGGNGGDGDQVRIAGAGGIPFRFGSIFHPGSGGGAGGEGGKGFLVGSGTAGEDGYVLISY